MARNNPMWQELSGKVEAVALFQGPEHYISPAWYPGKKEHGKVVPTWNYAVVHAYGHPQIIEDRDWLLTHLNQMTDYRESSRNQPWSVADAPPDYIEQNLKAIVGIEIPISRIEGKWKVSQNRSIPDRLGVIAGLETAGDEKSLIMAALVKDTIDDHE